MPIAFPTCLHYDNDNDAVSASSSSNLLASRASSHGHSPNQQNTTFPYPAPSPAPAVASASTKVNDPHHPIHHAHTLPSPRQPRALHRRAVRRQIRAGRGRRGGQRPQAHCAPGNAYVHTVFQGHPCPHAPLPAVLNGIRNGAGAEARARPSNAVEDAASDLGDEDDRLRDYTVFSYSASPRPHCRCPCSRVLLPGLVPLVPSYSISVTSVLSSSYSTPENALSNADKETTTTGEGH
ncbi:hypothetical protein GGX14DRAFT_389130 [Mycena pura]|uniref:Uncharacterized protein n=1 Tax=Mycena pura TaxID=153505 RepID=A0AAD6VST5_9AGAR|nr:hypothetical protein GGX14DRAFT_389130 [Mycena pura]